MTSQEEGSQPAEAAAPAVSTSASSSTKRVQVVGAPPPGPPIPKDDAHSDDDGEGGGDDEDDAASIGSQDGGSSDANRADDLLANFQADDENLELTHLNLKNADVRNLRLPRFASHLKSLCLRQNLISRLTADDIGCLSALEDLDLYDNSLEKTYGQVLEGCPQLE